MSKRLLSPTKDAERMRAKRKKEKQEIEILKNKLATKEEKLKRYENLLMRVVRECTCGMNEEVSERMEDYNTNLLKKK
jgi:hypothetical protein